MYPYMVISCIHIWSSLHVSIYGHLMSPQQEESELLAQLLKDKQLSEFEMHIKCLTELYSRTGAADKGSVWQALMATENVFSSISESRLASRYSPS